MRSILLLAILAIAVASFGYIQYERGKSYGQNIGDKTGYQNGVMSGFNIGYKIGYRKGYDFGYTKGQGDRIEYEKKRLIFLHQDKKIITLKEISKDDENKIWDFGDDQKLYMYAAVLHTIN